MGHGTLPDNHPQRIRHPQRPQRLGKRSWQPALHPRLAPEHHQRKHANSDDSEWAAGGEVGVRKKFY